MDSLTIIIILALVATVLALLIGLVTMSKGGSFDKEFGTRFMWMRVAFQGAAIALLLTALFLR